MWRLPRTLLWRLGLALMVVQMLVAIVLARYTYVRIRDFHYAQTEERLELLASLYVDRYAAALRGGDHATLQDMVVRDGRDGTLRLTIILPDGVVIADSQATVAEMDNHRYRAEIDEAFREGIGSQQRYSSTLREELMYVARHIEHEGQALGVVRAALPLTRIDASLARVMRVVGAAALVSVALTLLVFYVVSRRLSRQLSDVGDAAAKFASGDLSHLIAPPATSELSALVMSLNDMARQLNARIEELQVQQNEQQAILQSMSNAVVALDIDQRVLNTNHAADELLGLNGRATRGRLLHEIVRQPEIHRFVAAALADHTVASAELQLIGERQIRVRASCETLKGAGGSPKGLLLVLDDITKLRQLESIRSDFASNVSHELQTPITNLKGYIETLLDVGFTDRERATRFLTVIKENCGRLEAIVKDVMALTRLEQSRGDADIERIVTPIHVIVKSVIGQFSEAVRTKRIDLTAQVPTDVEAKVHGHLVEQAIANLVSNAIRYSPGGTTVTIDAHRTERGDIEIAVIDQGAGIPIEHHARLFERFYRVDTGRSRELGGTGLGLAIVKHIALMHGGRVEVQSEVGAGSTFTLVLPPA